MANNLIYTATYGTLKSAFVTADLNSLATAGLAFGSGADAVIDNTTVLQPYMDVIVKLGSFTPGTGGYINLYLLTSMDGGTTYADPQTAILPAFGVPKYSHGLIVSATAKVVVIRGVVMPPGKSKLLFESQAGATLAASANTIQYWLYSYNLNG